MSATVLEYGRKWHILKDITYGWEDAPGRFMPDGEMSPATFAAERNLWALRAALYPFDGEEIDEALSR